jgi:hypothetical protein
MPAPRHPTTSTLKALLDLGANIDLSNNDRETSLFIAVSNKMWDLASILVERGADVTLGKDNGVTPLHWAVRHAHFPLASKLLTQGADVQGRTEEGYSMLQVMPHFYRTHCCEMAVTSIPPISLYCLTVSIMPDYNSPRCYQKTHRHSVSCWWNGRPI